MTFLRFLKFTVLSALLTAQEIPFIEKEGTLFVRDAIEDFGELLDTTELEKL